MVTRSVYRPYSLAEFVKTWYAHLLLPVAWGWILRCNLSFMLLLQSGLASSSDVYSCKLQDHSNQLRQLGSNHHMLQQQLIALTNRVDPAAAAVLAAAAAGIDDVTAVIGSVGRVDSHDEAEAGDTAQVSASNRDASLAQLLFEDSNTSVPAADSLEQQTSYVGRQPRCKQQSVVREDDCHNTAAKPEVAKGLVVGATRHLPLAMRLCLLESSLQELSRSLEAKAQAGKSALAVLPVMRAQPVITCMATCGVGNAAGNLSAGLCSIIGTPASCKRLGLLPAIAIGHHRLLQL